MDIKQWINERLTFIHGHPINRDDLSHLSVMEMLYLYGEIVHEFDIHIPSEYIKNDVFSSLNGLVSCIEGLLSQ